MKRLYRILSLALVCSSVFFYSCETLELDLTENPNALTPGDADINFYLNSIQEDLYVAWTVMLITVTTGHRAVFNKEMALMTSGLL